jgi:alpha-L-rhamnosidase
MIKSEWVKTVDAFDWQITIPANTTATIYLPVKDVPEILESGSPYKAEDSKTKDGISEIILSSGSYHYISQLK